MKTSRRDFIQKTALFTGVFTLGFDWFSADASAMEVVASAGRFNAFLSIDSLGKITLFSPNPEIGQGIKTAFPVVVAEELDVDWAQVQVEQANLDTKLFERQLTGGSGALKHSWERLRKAGATVRKMMMQAAADQWKVDVAKCKHQKELFLGLQAKRQLMAL
jgi:isoquinoline 1-oxidoreductase beta subunit